MARSFRSPVLAAMPPIYSNVLWGRVLLQPAGDLFAPALGTAGGGLGQPQTRDQFERLRRGGELCLFVVALA